MLHDLSETWRVYQDKKTIRERLDINVWLYQGRWAEQVEHQQALLVSVDRYGREYILI